MLINIAVVAIAIILAIILIVQAGMDLSRHLDRAANLAEKIEDEPNL